MKATRREFFGVSAGVAAVTVGAQASDTETPSFQGPAERMWLGSAIYIHPNDGYYYEAITWLDEFGDAVVTQRRIS